MKNDFSRRDFLKLLGTLPLNVLGSGVLPSTPDKQGRQLQNVIVLVFDAFSAYNISLYGYQRETTPTLAKLAEKAVVYHNHYSSANFTTPGTASLLTGTFLWSHRAFQYNAGIDGKYISQNIFSAFSNYYRLTYTHNPWVNTILRQFKNHIDEYVKRSRLFLNNDYVIPTLFEEGDQDVSFLSWLRTLRKIDNGYAYSLFLAHLYEKYDRQIESKFFELKRFYPRGIPALSDGIYYLLETAIGWFSEKVYSLPQPFLSYLHFLPPHDPYNTHRDFYKCFKDDELTLEKKPVDRLHFFTNEKFSNALTQRMKYDEYILYVDRELGRLIKHMETSGLLDNTWLILTSDHGEMFERGVIGHQTPLLYEPVIRIPLIIFEPGRKTRLDIHLPTNAVDILPTLLHVTGQQSANWTEGEVLPPYSSSNAHGDRSVYALEARTNNKYAPLTVITTTLIKGQYKLIYFSGYDALGGKNRVELYDLKADPEEINDLSLSKRETVNEMQAELIEKLAEKNNPYQ